MLELIKYEVSIQSPLKSPHLVSMYKLSKTSCLDGISSHLIILSRCRNLTLKKIYNV